MIWREDTHFNLIYVFSKSNIYILLISSLVISLHATDHISIKQVYVTII